VGAEGENSLTVIRPALWMPSGGWNAGFGPGEFSNWKHDTFLLRVNFTYRSRCQAADAPFRLTSTANLIISLNT
jgi:hypothetical protein